MHAYDGACKNSAITVPYSYLLENDCNLFANNVDEITFIINLIKSIIEN